MVGSAHRARVAAELRRMREDLGVPGEEVAVALGWSQSKVSRIENARIAVSTRDLATLLHYYGVSEEVRAELLAVSAEDEGVGGAWLVRAGGVTRRQGEVAAVETRVRSIRQYYPLMVPGQLQSPEYALAYTRSGGWPNPEAIVSRRMARQALLREDDGPAYAALLDARAFLAWPGSREAILSQLEYLRLRAELPKVSIRIIPLGVDRTASAVVPFTLYDFRAESSPRVVFVESQTADLYLSAPGDVETYSSLFDALATDALSPEDSLEHLASLTRYIEDLEDPRSMDGGRDES
ncbi:helix-turn-helix domain-containing protein [Micromonospora globispora]|uniref:helix-turn-helix domain-containing protein n=1 Tax=Micromonospora globispora TaxID=1450148 RepID=UPI0021AB931E|nr:helix-turn-helix transcriptional regulator [Micromonospora globispora]